MDRARTIATTELDAPRASVTRDVSSYLAIVAREQERYLDALATATALLTDGTGRLPAAAALHVRMTQQFMDAQRSILRSWADTDAKVCRIAETTVLEAAMLGLDVAGRLALPMAAETAAEHDLRRLLDGWWETARADSVAAIGIAQSESARWLEVARLATADEPVDDRADDRGAEQAGEPEGALPVVDLVPSPLSAMFEALHGSTLDAVLDELAVLLTDDVPGVPRTPTVDHERATDGSVAGSPVAGPTLVLPPDGFDRFWASNRTVEPVHPVRHVVRDAVVPMLLVLVLLVPVLLLIG